MTALKNTTGDIYVPIAIPFMAAASSNAGGCGWKAPFRVQIQSATLTWSSWREPERMASSTGWSP